MEKHYLCSQAAKDRKAEGGRPHRESKDVQMDGYGMRKVFIMKLAPGGCWVLMAAAMEGRNCRKKLPKQRLGDRTSWGSLKVP